MGLPERHDRHQSVRAAWSASWCEAPVSSTELHAHRLAVSFAKTSSDSVDDGPCSRDRPRNAGESTGSEAGSRPIGFVGPTTERGGVGNGTASGVPEGAAWRTGG